MLEIKFTAFAQKINKEKARAAIREHIRQSLIRALGAFLVAAVPRIPIYTGFSRSSFKEVEDLVGKVVSDARTGRNPRIRPGRSGGNQNRLLRGRQFYYFAGGRVLKTTNSGRAFATPSTAILLPQESKAGWRVRFSVDISYLTYLDQIKWHAFKTGEAAFVDRLKELLNDNPPDLTKFIIRRQVS